MLVRVEALQQVPKPVLISAVKVKSLRLVQHVRENRVEQRFLLGQRSCKGEAVLLLRLWLSSLYASLMNTKFTLAVKSNLPSRHILKLVIRVF